MMKTGAMKPGSNKLMLVLGLTLGLLSAVLVFVYLSQASSDGGGSSTGAPTFPVVVTAMDVSGGTTITEEMVTVQRIEQTFVLDGAFQRAEDVVGVTTVMPLVAGEQVIASKIVGSELSFDLFGDDRPLSIALPEGMRAVSAAVNPAITAGGMIRPGDFVDLILGVKVKVPGEGDNPGGNNTILRTVMQNVQVIALDQNITRSSIGGDPEEAIRNPTGESLVPNAVVATFAVEPVHAEILALADLCRDQYDGRLTMSLRGHGDRGTMPERSTYNPGGGSADCASLFNIPMLP